MDNLSGTSLVGEATLRNFVAAADCRRTEWAGDTDRSRRWSVVRGASFACYGASSTGVGVGERTNEMAKEKVRGQSTTNLKDHLTTKHLTTSHLKPEKEAQQTQESGPKQTEGSQSGDAKK